MEKLRVAVQNDFDSLGYLSKEVFDQFIISRFGVDHSLTDKIISTCTKEVVHSLTRCYNDIQHSDWEMNIRMKTYPLLGLPWLGFSSVTHLMHLHKPDEFKTIDSDAWEATFGEAKKSFTIKDYLNYLKQLK